MSILNQHFLRFCEPSFGDLAERCFNPSSIKREPVFSQPPLLFPKPPVPAVALPDDRFSRPRPPSRRAKSAS